MGARIRGRKGPGLPLSIERIPLPAKLPTARFQMTRIPAIGVPVRFPGRRIRIQSRFHLHPTDSSASKTSGAGIQSIIPGSSIDSSAFHAVTQQEMIDAVAAVDFAAIMG